MRPARPPAAPAPAGRHGSRPLGGGGSSAPSSPAAAALAASAEARAAPQKSSTAALASAPPLPSKAGDDAPGAGSGAGSGAAVGESLADGGVPPTPGVAIAARPQYAGVVATAIAAVPTDAAVYSAPTWVAGVCAGWQRAGAAALASKGVASKGVAPKSRRWARSGAALADASRSAAPSPSGLPGGLSSGWTPEVSSHFDTAQARRRACSSVVARRYSAGIVSGAAAAAAGAALPFCCARARRERRRSPTSPTISSSRDDSRRSSVGAVFVAFEGGFDEDEPGGDPRVPLAIQVRELASGIIVRDRPITRRLRREAGRK